MNAPLACWRCDDPGHPWTECDRAPAKDAQELNDRINDVVRRWDAGKGFRLSVKTRLIEIERNAFKPKPKKGKQHERKLS